MDKKIQRIADILRGCKSILFITGAGISAESGLPTYRGIGGLYNDAVTEDGIPIETALAGEMLSRRPEVTWKYLARIEENCRNASFNRAHSVIAEIEKRFSRVWVLTQNIDGFHREAGSKNVIEIHGDMHDLFCPACGWEKTIQDYSRITIPPLCPECGHIVRPGVVFFGEMLPYRQVQTLYEQMHLGFDMYFTIGTTSVFPYIREPILKGKASGKPTVEIDPGRTEVSDLVDIKLSMGAAEALEAIWRCLG